MTAQRGLQKCAGFVEGGQRELRGADRKGRTSALGWLCATALSDAPSSSSPYLRSAPASADALCLAETPPRRGLLCDLHRQAIRERWSPPWWPGSYREPPLPSRGPSRTAYNRQMATRHRRC